MEWAFDGPVIEWRGPAPYLFVPVPEGDSDEIREEARALVYWGQVPVSARIGGTEFTTALFPKDGCYLLPLKSAVRRAEGIELGAYVAVSLRIKRLD